MFNPFFMPKNQKLLLSILLAGLFLSLPFWYLSFNKTSWTEGYTKQLILDLKDKVEEDHDITLKFFKGRLVHWQGDHLPSINPESRKKIIKTGSSGAYLIDSVKTNDSLTIKVKTLARHFDIKNRYTEEISRCLPFHRVSIERDPFTKQIRVEFPQETYYVEVHASTLSNYEQLALILSAILSFVLLAYCLLQVRAWTVFTPLLLLLSYLYTNYLDWSILENLTEIFSPASYASSNYINSYFDLAILLLGALFLSLYSKNSKAYFQLFTYAIISIIPIFFIPSIINDSDLLPEINLPFLLSTQGVLFWILIVLIALILTSAINTLLRSEFARKHLIAYSVLTLGVIALSDYLGFVDLNHVLWPCLLGPLAYLILKKLKPSFATSFVLLVIALGLSYSIQKYRNHKLLAEANIFAEQMIGLDNHRLDNYILREELKRNKNEIRFISPDEDLKKFIDDKILVSYLDHYEAIPYPYVASSTNSIDSIFLSIKEQRFWLKKKDFAPEKGFPVILADRSWQVYPSTHFPYGIYYKGKLKSQSSSYVGAKLLSKVEKKSNLLISDRGNQAIVVQIPYLSLQDSFILFLCILALVISIQLFAIDILRLGKLGIKLRNRIRFAVMGMCVITAFILAYMGYSNLSKQFIHQNKRQLLELAKGAERQLLKNEREIWQGNLLLVNKLSETLEEYSQDLNVDLSFYQNNGSLAASTVNLLYQQGFKSEILQSENRDYLNSSLEPLFKEEKIASLEFLSLHLPIVSKDGILRGSIYLPLFDKQEFLDQELKSYTSSYLNTLLLTLGLALILSHLLARSIGRPINRVETALKNMELGGSLQSIHYQANDEIGALVAAYNKKLEQLNQALEQITKKERESAWKHMAQQVAHEIKNPLTPLKLKSQWLYAKMESLQEEDLRAKTKDLIQTILDQTEILKNIANEFSQYASLSKTNAEEFSLRSELENICQLFEDQSDGEIKISGSDYKILMDKTHFKRVFTNLLQNSFQAMLPDRKAMVSIDIHAKEEKIWVSLSDNGKGIANENLNKIFEPNFTTKSSGTGLGLAMVKNMLLAADAEINVFSKLNSGTTFEIIFPNKLDNDLQ